MATKDKKRGCVSPAILDAAKVISELKNEDLDELEAKFYSDYVEKNLRLLTEKARGEINDAKQDG